MGSEPEGLLRSKLDGTAEMAATSAHNGRRARAECCMANVYIRGEPVRG